MATHRQLMTLMSKLSVDKEQRHEIIWRFTHGRTESTKDLHASEVNELCTRLQGVLPQNEHKAQEALMIKKKRSVVLTIATETGIHQPHDWNAFNGWMLRSSILKKPLNLYNSEELDSLIKQMYKLRDRYRCSASKIGSKAWWNENAKTANLN